MQSTITSAGCPVAVSLGVLAVGEILPPEHPPSRETIADPLNPSGL
jgi:hypothetical protein